MSEDRTRRLVTAQPDQTLSDFLARHRVTVVVLSGGVEGSEFSLDQPKITFGRGPNVDFAFEDSSMSREHAAVEFSAGRFRIRDLGSTNGTKLNGKEITAEDLAHGDRLQIGEHVLQFIVEEVEQQPKAYVLSGE